MIDEKVVKQILEEIFSSVEDVETQSAAMLQFLKDKGMANDEELAPYIERAKTSSGVRWVAIRARVDYLLSSVINKEEEEKAESEIPWDAILRKSDQEKTGGHNKKMFQRNWTPVEGVGKKKRRVGAQQQGADDGGPAAGGSFR